MKMNAQYFIKKFGVLDYGIHGIFRGGTPLDGVQVIVRWPYSITLKRGSSVSIETMPRASSTIWVSPARCSACFFSAR